MNQKVGEKTPVKGQWKQWDNHKAASLDSVCIRQKKYSLIKKTNKRNRDADVTWKKTEETSYSREQLVLACND